MQTLIGRTGKIMEVNTNGAAVTCAIEEPETFGWTSVSKDIDANDTAILLTNDSSSKHLHIVRAYAYTNVPSAIDFFLPAFAAFTGTAITGIALNRTGVTVAPVTALGDTTGDTLANIFATLYTNELTTDQFGIWLELGGDLVLGYHDSFGIAMVAEPTLTNSAIIGYFHNNDHTTNE